MACQRPSSPAAVIGLSNNGVISLRFLRCVRCVGWKPRLRSRRRCRRNLRYGCHVAVWSHIALCGTGRNCGTPWQPGRAS